MSVSAKGREDREDRLSPEEARKLTNERN